MPGFPIRTPSDHSSVDNSPRTIAASHVLHRLLMPRHPPCALTHLTTTRCSHPLCNTQHTTTPRTHHRHHNHPHHTGDCVRPARPEVVHQKKHHAGVFSGPNSVRARPALTCTSGPISDLCSTQPHPHPTNQTGRHDARSGAESVKGDPEGYTINLMAP